MPPVLDVVPTYLSPPRGLNFLSTIEYAYTFVLIGLPLSSILIPLLFLIFFLSDAPSRRTYLFALNVGVVLLGILQGVLITVVQTYIILRPEVPISDALFLSFIGVVLYTPILVDLILILRLTAVYPASLTRPSIRLSILLPPVLSTAARIAMVTIVLNRWSFLSERGTAIMASQLIWPRNKFIIADWSIQLFENAYCSTLFVYRLRARKAFSSRMYREQSFATRIRAVFYIALSNFIFPTILSGFQLFYIIHDPSIRQGAIVVSINNCVSIIGIVFCTIWCATDVWKRDRRHASIYCSSMSQSQQFQSYIHHAHARSEEIDIRQSAISLSGIAPNLHNSPTFPPSRPNTSGTQTQSHPHHNRTSHSISFNRLSLSSLSMLSESVKSAIVGKRASQASSADRRFAMEGPSKNRGGKHGRKPGRRGSKLMKSRTKPSAHRRKGSGSSDFSAEFGYGFAYKLGPEEVHGMSQSQIDQSVDSRTPILTGGSRFVKMDKEKTSWDNEKEKGHVGVQAGLANTPTPPYPYPNPYPSHSHLNSSTTLSSPPQHSQNISIPPLTLSSLPPPTISSSAHQTPTTELSTDTEFDFMVPTPPAPPHAHLPRSSTPSTSTRSVSSSTRIKSELRRGEITVMDFRARRTPEPPSQPQTSLPSRMGSRDERGLGLRLDLEGGDVAVANPAWFMGRDVPMSASTSWGTEIGGEDVPTPRQASYDSQNQNRPSMQGNRPGQGHRRGAGAGGLAETRGEARNERSTGKKGNIVPWQ